MPFDPERLKQAKGFDPERLKKVKETPSESSTLDKLNRGAFETVSAGLEAVAAPFELVGEALRVPIEQSDGFRAPTVIQRLFPSTKTAQPPADPISLGNKLLRSGAGAVSGIPRGTLLESARAAYNAPRGTMGAVEDTAAALLLGKLAPKALNAPVEATTEALSKVTSGAKNAAGWATKKAIRVGTGVSEEAQTLLAKRPQDVARQTDFSGLGDKVAETANALSEKLTELDNQAWDTLVTLKAEPKSKLIQILNGVKSQFIGKGKTNIGNSDRQAVAQINKYIERVKSINQAGAKPGTEQFLGQDELKNIVQSIQKDATYGLVKNEPVNRAVKAARKGIDGYLKSQNPEYEIAMKPVQEAASSLEETVKRFRLERNQEGRFVPSKVTVDRVTQLPKGKNPILKRTVDGLKKTTGVDLTDEAKLTAAKQSFQAGENSRGSARTMLGTILGGAFGGGVGGFAGGGVGSAVGALAGRTADYYGGPMAAKIIESLTKLNTGTGRVLKAVNMPRIKESPFTALIAVTQSRNSGQNEQPAGVR